MRATLIIILALCFSNLITSQTIEKFSIDSGGAIATVGDIDILYTIGEVNVQELSTGSISVSEGFINADFEIKIDPKLFLQGPMLNPATTGLMNDDLRVTSYIPTTSPYADVAECNSSVFNTTGNNAIVDWVWVELRDANDNTNIINARSALLQRDGDVVDVDGTSNVGMQAAPTNYYVVVNHRNHLGTMSASIIGLNENTVTTVDFTNSGFLTFGTEAQVVLGSGDTALWAGDANGDGQVNFSGDINSVSLDVILFPTNTSFSTSYDFVDGYFQSDVFLDGNVSFSNENNQLLLSILLYPLNTSFSSQYNQFLEQLPSPSNLRNAAQRNIDQTRHDRGIEIINN